MTLNDTNQLSERGGDHQDNNVPLNSIIINERNHSNEQESVTNYDAGRDTNRKQSIDQKRQMRRQMRQEWELLKHLLQEMRIALDFGYLPMNNDRKIIKEANRFLEYIRSPKNTLEANRILEYIKSTIIKTPQSGNDL